MDLYRAVVEDNNSPGKDGKVRVRIHGIHTAVKDADFNRIWTEELPWAEVMGNVSDGKISGIGHTAVPRQGVMVWVVLDNGDSNKPIVIGSCAGVPSEENLTGAGFEDPHLLYPLEDRLGEPDTNRLVRGLTTETQDLVIENLIDTEGVGNDGAAVIVVEPELLTELAEYTEIEIRETAGFGVPAHLMEVDNTPGNERIRNVHKMGAYDEYRPDGSKINKVVGEKSYNLNDGELVEYISGDVQRFLESGLTEIIEEAVLQEFNATLNQSILEAVEIKYKDTFVHLVEKSVNIVFNETLDEYVKEAVTRVFDDTLTETVALAVEENYNDTQTTTVAGIVEENYQIDQNTNVSGKQTVIANEISLNANRIDLNGQVYINGVLQTGT